MTNIQGQQTTRDTAYIHNVSLMSNIVFLPLTAQIDSRILCREYGGKTV